MNRSNPLFLVITLLIFSVLAIIVGFGFASAENGTITTTGEIIKIDTEETYDVDEGTSVTYVYHVKYEDEDGIYHISELTNFVGGFDLHEVIEIKYKPGNYDMVYGNGGSYSNYLKYGGFIGVVISLIIFIISYFKSKV